MKRNIVMSMAVSSLLLCGCNYNDRNFDGLDEMSQPENVFKLDYTLTEADYAAISDDKTNQKIAKEAGKDKALGYVKTDLYLSENIPAATYLPAFLAAKYYTADDGSSVKVTYQYKENKSELLSDYSSIKLYAPTNKDYAAIYTGGKYAPYLSSDNNEKVVDLLSGYKDPKEGDVVFIDYRYSPRTTAEDALKGFLLWQNFEGLATGKLTSLKEWSNDKDWFITSKGGADWKVTAYDNNQYVQFSAKDTKGECVAWLVTPEITLGTGDKLSFDVKVGYFNAECLSVWISTDFAGSDVNAASWTELTGSFPGIPKGPETGYSSSFISAGSCDLSAYNGQTVRIAFKYVGDGANKKTTTYQIDNIMIGTDIPVGGGFGYEPAYAVKVYNDKGEWKEQNKNVFLLSSNDYKDMGVDKLYFTDEIPAVNYIPAYLASQVEYPLDGDARIVVYRFYDSKKVVKIYSDEYVYNASTARWELNTRIVEKTDQFVYKDGAWKFDPSTIITLKADKNSAESTEFYKVIVDYVANTFGKDYYQNGYTNAEYYYGASYYQNNFAFRVEKWKSDHAAAAAYKDMSDDELKKLMFDRLREAFIPALEKLYGDAVPVDGVDVIYTINFSIYDGSATKPWTIKYEVKEKGKFTYIEDSLQEVK